MKHEGHAADAAHGASCAGQPDGRNACNVNGCFVCTSGAWVDQPLYHGASSATCDASHEGLVRWSHGNLTLEICTGTAWTSLVAVQATPTPTAPNGSGYFVITGTTYNGNLGGLAGANAKCVTELGTTYTSWNGYTDANNRGLLNASHVFASLCTNATCNNLMPLTTYYFARADDAVAGGASFTTDSNGAGPGDTNNWSAANYFSGSYLWWSNRGQGTSTAWSLVNLSNPCLNWFSSSAVNSGYAAAVSNTSQARWYVTSGTTCDSTEPLICFVNP